MKSVISGSVVGGIFISICFLVSLTAYASEAPYDLAWTRQLGTDGYDYSKSVAVDPYGNVYISGFTTGSLGGIYAGGSTSFPGDAFLAKYNSSGTLLWKRQLGTNDGDKSWSVAADALGNAYISGYTLGSLDGSNAGNADAFLAKYDASGNVLWTRQLGTWGWDESWSVGVDISGNIYITGYTSDGLEGPTMGYEDTFLAKYDSSGSLLWKRQLGTSDHDWSSSLALDGLGNAYITGYTRGSLYGTNAGDYDIFLAKYNSSGSLLWTRQIGTPSHDESWGVATDGFGNVYISGWTKGSLCGPNAGESDAFLAKYNSFGDLLWMRQIGTPFVDESWSLAVDAFGNAYISGGTAGCLDGCNAGARDAFLAKYDPNGIPLMTCQIGTSMDDYSLSVAVDGTGNAYISGWTNGSLGGPNAGGADVFLAKLTPAGSTIPEPGTVFMIATAVLGFAGVVWRRRR
jgi:hypothetical protein